MQAWAISETIQESASRQAAPLISVKRSRASDTQETQPSQYILFIYVSKRIPQKKRRRQANSRKGT